MKHQELSFAEKRDWLRLIRTPTIGPVAFSSLLRRFGSAAAALDALPALMKGKTATVTSKERAEAEMEASEQLGIHLIAIPEETYPPLLRTLGPPPPIISVWGQPDILQNRAVALIGSRNASAIGQRFARALSTQLGEAGLTIISGLARGIDTAAHHAALETGTAAVLGGGVDHVYPRQNAELFEAIKERGALVSESPLGYRATARDFPRRNRIISGLSLGVVVIEAAERSGTLITARYALEQNREVMAVPGSPLDPRNKGCNRLIRQGAGLIESASDVIDILGNLAAAASPDLFRAPMEDYDDNSARPPMPDSQDIDQAKKPIRALLSPTPSPRDEIIRLSGLTINLASAALLEMELTGEITVEPDGRVANSYD